MTGGGRKPESELVFRDHAPQEITGPVRAGRAVQHADDARVVMRIPVSMATAELGVCPECQALVFRSDAGLLDVWLDGPYYADTDTPHAHQPAGGSPS